MPHLCQPVLKPYWSMVIRWSPCRYGARQPQVYIRYGPGKGCRTPNLKVGHGERCESIGKCGNRTDTGHILIRIRIHFWPVIVTYCFARSPRVFDRPGCPAAGGGGHDSHVSTWASRVPYVVNVEYIKAASLYKLFFINKSLHTFRLSSLWRETAPTCRLPNPRVGPCSLPL